MTVATLEKIPGKRSLSE